jgi:hypothetical protein
MSMPRSADELEQAALDAEAWLDTLDPSELKGEDISDLRAITQGVADLADAQQQLVEAVRVARQHGRSWGRIGMALGVSRQAARQQYADLIDA